MTHRLVIFDFDGTLADSFPWFLKTINTVADKYRFKRIDHDQLDALRGCSTRELMARLDLPLWKVPLVTAEMRRLMAASASEIRLFRGIDHLLGRLHDTGIETAVVTSNSQQNVQCILGPDNLARVHYLECGASLFGKRTKFKKLLQRTGYLPTEVLCIGDEIRDAQAAAATGLPFVGVAWGYAHADVLHLHSARPPFASVDEMANSLCPDPDDA